MKRVPESIGRDQESRHGRIYSKVKNIPSGKIATYGQIARLAGMPGKARLVGYALKMLPENSGVPWFRVINAKGRISFPPGSAEYAIQKALLESEGVIFSGKGVISMKKHQWRR